MALILTLGAASLTVGATGPAARADATTTTTTISGTAFADLDRDGTVQPEESRFEGHLLYLFDGSGAYVRGAFTDAHGRYAFTELPAGTYEVAYAASTWWDLREAWVPTTTGSLLPRHAVSTVSGPVTADFGWRPLERSTDLAAPMTEFIGPNGLSVASYNDAVTAREIYDAVMRGHVGAEAASVTVRFGHGSSSAHAGTIVHHSDGSASYEGVVHASYLSWLDGHDRTLSHEYGHAWSHYHAYVVQGDATLSSYLDARGLLGDDGLYTSYAWDPWEMIAEDYRQLLGSPTARVGGQVNGDIPPADAVEGLATFLRDVFTRPPSDDDPAPAPAPDPDPEPEPDPAADPDPEPDPTPEPDAEPIELTVTVAKVKGAAVAELRWREAGSARVDVYRDGARVATVPNDGLHQDETGEKGPLEATYRVCEAGTDVCSTEASTGDDGGASSKRAGGKNK